MDRNTRIIQKIEALEKQLKDLKIELKKETDPPKATYTKDTDIKAGDEVSILNPRPGQDKEGVVTKINSLTKYVSVRTTKGTLVRTRKNVARKNE